MSDESECSRLYTHYTHLMLEHASFVDLDVTKVLSLEIKFHT